MKTCLAQIESHKGDLQGNIDHHMKVLRQLPAGAADLVMFPELSLTNYDPDIALSAAIDPQDNRLKVFQEFADTTGITVAVGVPTSSPQKPFISMLVFFPNQNRRVIGKRYLHPDEFAFFSPAGGCISVLDMSVRVGVAICYEISVKTHIEEAMACGIDLYLASVAKTASGIGDAEASLRAKAQQGKVPILLANCVGSCESKEAGGRSLAIDQDGRLVAQLGNTEEGLLIYDNVLRTAISVPIRPLAH